ncbi:DEAD/DEAH box helicase [Candidatus Phytoplasma meliae]|uniref:DEAD/DEAH box helicase n=1 Tax=Candidatus Phytoplasma meliae TaxID=1848402 RepID=A0ABS5CZ52_9MOLU|nr:DEAD/DEAH box helicase [Candidatus Phytoplasma meliae]MBP5836146.1 DEAD/DEAH box helicase [Candidatus Phytoplasma meliae]MBP5836249.1 DEAD/DEAH box helicase [Candidatus Phytoplasma meliae]
MQNYIQKKIIQLQFKTLTPIQKEVFAQFSKPGNLVGVAPTGTGKTHAYLLPLLSQIDFQKPFLQAIILVPTNDLVFQVWEMLKKVEKSNFTKILYGGMDKQKALSQFSKKQPSLIIATPEKFLEYAFKLHKINLKHVSYLVLDEADMMFDQVFLTSLEPLVNHLKAKILLFSATITLAMKPFINRYFGKAHFIDVRHQNTSKCTFFLLEASVSNRLQILIHLTKVLNPYLALIFVNNKKEQELIFQNLCDDRLKLLNFNASSPVKQRKQELKAIHKLKYQYVVASDLASRGIDFDASCVIHYNLPSHLEFFHHRSGRTARMGKKGEVIVLYDFYDVKEKDKIKKLTQMGIVFHNASLSHEGFLRHDQKSMIQDGTNKVKTPSRASKMLSDKTNKCVIVKNRDLKYNNDGKQANLSRKKKANSYSRSNHLPKKQTLKGKIRSLKKQKKKKIKSQTQGSNQS